MFQSLKKTLLAGLGVVAFTREKLHKLVHELVEQGELTSEQGKKLLDVLVDRGDAEGRQLADWVSGEVERWLGEGPIVSRADFRGLEERVRALEARVGLSAAAKGATAEPSAPDS